MPFGSAGENYLAAADNNLMVSFIQSNFTGFGSGILIPETGIALHNRGCGFTLESGHPNEYAPAKRPYHTIMPGFLSQDDQPLGPFGIMGGPMPPQAHVQVVVNMVDCGLNPQAALDAPRWQFVADNYVLLEPSVSKAIALDLVNRGHIICQDSSLDNPKYMQMGQFGRGQIILRQNNTFIAASEPRSDGLAMVW